jgi:hypothetical protein
MAQTTYTAALQVSAQVLPKTLLDYLRWYSGNFI